MAQAHEFYMLRCLQLAAQAKGMVAPNPLVGCVIVHENRVIGEGYHHRYGGPHAEVEAINRVENRELLRQATLYVNLEPCAHYGKTPPCADLILETGIPEVVVACADPFEAVNGKGIARLREAGVKVHTGVLEREARFLNRRFFTFHEKKRPYILLKWAQTADGFIDRKRTSEIPVQYPISGLQSRELTHRWRTQESAILVGTRTVLHDNPQLTARLYSGPQPLRIAFDRKLEIPESFHLYDGSAATWILNSLKEDQGRTVRYRKIDFSRSIEELCQLLFQENIHSLLVEGGSHTLQSFIDSGYCDEIRVFVAPLIFNEGLKAPFLPLLPNRKEAIGKDFMFTYYSF